MDKTVKHYKFFQNSECEYFPCHKMADREKFNCLFCYCPLYPLGKECGGNYVMTKDGIKDCTGCTIPHAKGGYEYVVGKLKEKAKVEN